MCMLELSRFERYATPLPQLTIEVVALAARVDEHLKKMGAVWK